MLCFSAGFVAVAWWLVMLVWPKAAIGMGTFLFRHGHALRSGYAAYRQSWDDGDPIVFPLE